MTAASGYAPGIDARSYIERAIALARRGVLAGRGGPFGAVVVLDDRVIGEGCNEVLAACDPTAHAEVVAIRAAAARLGTFSLAGATIYATCEPCPMCLGAIYWARIERLCFASTRQDAAAIGFDDERFYHELALAPQARSLHVERIASAGADALLALWLSQPDRRLY